MVSNFSRKGDSDSDNMHTDESMEFHKMFTKKSTIRSTVSVSQSARRELNTLNRKRTTRILDKKVSFNKKERLS
jgi:hypothetical protein